ncbi:hypothetical protein JCM11251_005400 [Rhodosporidiobolus azoricus]
MRTFISLAALSLLPAALAKVYIYKPVASSYYAPGDSFTVSWRDDGESPSWTEWGASTLTLMTGSATSQTVLSDLGTLSSASSQHEVLITIDGSWGPDSSDYFIRVQSDAGKAANGDPLQAFSARFRLQEMTGEWSPAVQAQLAGSAVPAAGTTTTVAANTRMTTSARATASAAAASETTGSLSGASLASKVASSTSGSSSTSAASAAAASESAGTTGNGASSVKMGGAAAVLGAVAAVALM